MIESTKTRRLMALLALVSLSSGCQLMHDTRPVVVMARDAETHQPIPGALVSLSYPVPPDHSPQAVADHSGPDGIVRLPASVPGDEGVFLAVTANGYHTENQSVTSAAVSSVPPLKLFEKSDQRPVQFVVELFADPDPTLDLVLPAGYKGLVRVELTVKPDAPFTPHQRQFTVMVPPTGNVQVVGPPILDHAFGPTDYHFRYADGVPLTRRCEGAADQTAIGYWWLKCDEISETFLVGTLLDFDTFRRTHKLQDGVGGNRRGGAVAGGHGGKHRGGGGGNQQQPADGTSTGTTSP